MSKPVKEDEVEDLVEKKVGNETKKLKQKIERLERNNQELRKEIKSQNQEINLNVKKNKDVSRRDFLKKLGAGAIGLSVLSLPGTALDVKTSKPFSVHTTETSDGTLEKGLTVDKSQNLSIPNGDINLEENDLKNVNKLNELSMTDSVEVHSYQTEADVPNIPEGSIVYIQDQNQIFVEDGT